MRYPALLLALLLLTLLPSLAQAQQPRMRGTWIIDREHSDDVNARLNGALAKMNIVTRQLARPRMRRTNIVYPRLVLAYDERTVRLDMEGSPPLTVPTSGQPLLWHRESGVSCPQVQGECVSVTTVWEADRLEQNFVAENGQRVNVFTVSPDGNTLTLNVTLTSQHLQAPLTYRLVYTRAG